MHEWGKAGTRSRRGWMAWITDGLVDHVRTLAFALGEQELREVLSREGYDLTWVFTGSFRLQVRGEGRSWEITED